MGKRKYLRGTFATFKAKDGTPTVIMDDLAKKLLNYGDIPERLNCSRAYEIALLAQAYLNARSILRKQKGLP